MIFWYTTAVGYIRDLLTDICLVGAAVSFAAYFALRHARRIVRVSDWLVRVPRSQLTAFALFAAIATVCAQKSGTNGVGQVEGGTNQLQMVGGGGTNAPMAMLLPQMNILPQSLQPLSLPASGVPISVGDYEVLCGYRLESVATNEFYSYAMTTNGSRYGRWWKRGAYEDVFSLDLGEMRFPLGTSLCDSLWVYTWGMAGARLGDASNRIAATGVPMSAVPCASQFWSAALPGGARRLTWQDFALNRDTNTPVSAQLDLYPSGDFVARSNLVESVYRRINPDDWDDDGYPNDVDPNPYAFDEDGFGPRQSLPEGAKSNAYCWVEIVVSNANALVTFTGDGPSALPDPRFVAKAGETNRVTVLIGKTYTVTCNMPIFCVDKSSFDIDVWQNSPTELHICWPVTIEVNNVELRMENVELWNINNFSFSTLHFQFFMSVWPDCLGGSFTWTNSCCSISSSGGVFTYSCNDACHCTGCGALGYYGYENYRLPAYGGWCGCSSYGEHDERPCEEDDEGPHDAGASAVFSKSAVIFEDAYTNSLGNSVGRQSTQTELHCVAHGGPSGGHVRFEILGEDKLERVSGHVLPVEQDVGPGKKIDFTIVYKGRLPSTSAEDIIVTTTFTENAQGATTSSSQSKITSVKVELETVYEAPENTCAYRHEYGVGERIKCRHYPTSVSVVWRVASYVAENVISDASGCDKEITFAHLAVNKPRVEVECGNAEYSPQFVLIEPMDVVAYSASWNGTCLPRGRAGGFGMKMNLYVYPMYVSFQGIDMVEVPCNDVVPPIGYYASTNFDGYLSHCSDAGAGWWHHVKAGNYWTEDEAGSGERHAPWSNGVLVWNIPIAWNYRFDDVLSWPRNHYSSTCKKIGSDSSFQQIYGIDGTGSVTIEKFDHVSERNTNDVVIVDYSIVHEGNHQ